MWRLSLPGANLTNAGLAREPGRPSSSQLVDRLGGLIRPLGRHIEQRALDRAPHTTDRDAEHALAGREQVDGLVVRGALVHRHAVAQERDLGEVLDPASAQVVHGDADLLQRDAGVDEALDDLEQEKVAEAVEALRARAGRVADLGNDQAGTCPVVELTVRDLSLIHISEPTRLGMISYAVFCLKK